VSSYIEAERPVNGQVDTVEVEIPAFLPRRPAQAASSKPRRRIRSETWSSISAAIVRQHQALPPNSPRLKPTLPRLRWLEPAVGTAAVGGGRGTPVRTIALAARFLRGTLA
jgi:hypothetical protein